MWYIVLQKQGKILFISNRMQKNGKSDIKEFMIIYYTFVYYRYISRILIDTLVDLVSTELCVIIIISRQLVCV